MYDKIDSTQKVILFFILLSFHSLQIRNNDLPETCLCST